MPRSPLQVLQSARPRLVGMADAIRLRCGSFLTMDMLAPIPESHHRTDSEVLAEAERIVAARAFDGPFSSALERRYLKATTEARFAMFCRTSLLGILLYDLFVPIDALIVPDVAWLAVALHFGVGTPVALAILVAMRFGSRSYGLASVTIGTMMATTLTLFLTSRSPHVHAIAEAFVLIIVTCNVGVAMPFNWAFAITGLGNLAITGAVLAHPMLDGPTQVFVIVLNGTLSLLSLSGNYRIEASVRRSFLFALRERLRADDLAATNLVLRDLAAVDGLTGVANRRHFDASLARIWEQADGRPLALLMIDIDHFKGFNDRFGHRAGDDCLRLVARTLADAAPPAGATLTRYGGEEFALLLEGADVAAAMGTAEDLRRRIAALAGRFGTDAVPVAITISIGCAAALPGLSMGPLDLVAAADLALYCAKHAGRNRSRAADTGALRAVASPGGAGRAQDPFPAALQRPA